MICSHCQHDNVEGAQACALCGATLGPAASAPPPVVAPAPVITAQAVASRAPIPNHLVWAILATLFCCLPGGIVAIVYASRVDSLAAAGQYDAAREASDKARFWSMLSLFTPVLLIVGYFLIMLLGMGTILTLESL